MAIAPTPIPSLRQPLRLWPGVILVTLQWLVRFGLPAVAPETMQVAVMGGLLGGVLVLLWWVFFSRAPWRERLGAVLLMVVGLFAASRLLHESIATGAMGMLFPVLAVPGLSLALVVWAVAWNHPVLVGDILLVRNDQEMAAFRLASKGLNATK